MGARFQVAALGAALVACGRAAAQSPDEVPAVRGAVEARALVGFHGRHGGAMSTDLWVGRGVVKLGGTFGAGAVSAGGGQSSRVITPVGLSLALLARDEASGPTLVARAGPAAAAAKGGLTVTPWLSCALGYRFSLGEGASIRVGADTWLFWRGGGIYLAPYLGLGF